MRPGAVFWVIVKNKPEKTCQPSVVCLLAVCWPSVGQLSVDYRFLRKETLYIISNETNALGPTCSGV